MKAIKSNRTFRLWDFRVTHDQLLIRSPKSDAHELNYDIVLTGVEHLALPTLLRGIEIHHADESSMTQYRERIGQNLLPERAFVLRSDGFIHFLVAANVRSEENNLDIFQSSLELPPQVKSGDRS